MCGYLTLNVMFSLLNLKFSVRLLDVEWLVRRIYETEIAACWYYTLNFWLVALEW